MKITTRIGLFLAAALTAVSASAQDGDEIKRRVKNGQTVIVTDEQGRQFSGKVVGLGQDAITLAEGRRYSDVSYQQIATIARRGDRIFDGALIGFSAGLVTGFVTAPDDDNNCAFCFEIIPDYAYALAYGLIGAAAGAVIDALISGKREIYRRPVKGRVSVSPAFNKSRRGVVVSVAW